MAELSTTAAPAPVPPRATRPGSPARLVVATSLAVTAAAALVALTIALAFDVRWSLWFIFVRWGFVAVLLTTPLVHQVATRAGATWRMPWVLQTPATALLLTCESIALDILIARLH